MISQRATIKQNISALVKFYMKQQEKKKNNGNIFVGKYLSIIMLVTVRLLPTTKCYPLSSINTPKPDPWANTNKEKTCILGIKAIHCTNEWKIIF